MSKAVHIRSRGKPLDNIIWNKLFIVLGILIEESSYAKYKKWSIELLFQRLE